MELPCENVIFIAELDQKGQKMEMGTPKNSPQLLLHPPQPAIPTFIHEIRIRGRNAGF